MYVFAPGPEKTDRTCTLNRSDLSGRVPQKAKWTSPLHRSCRDDQNAYVEHPIWTSDERDMTSGSSAPRTDRSDRLVGAVRPVFAMKYKLGVVI